MTISSDTATQAEGDDRQRSETIARSAGLAGVARRMAGRTTDLIAVGIVLIGSLTFGRQVVEWWRAEPEQIGQSLASSDSSRTWGNAPVEIEFGDAAVSLSRLSVTGDRDLAMRRLVAECRSLAENSPGVPFASPAADEMIARLSKLTPVESSSTGWSIYRLDDQFSLVAAVHHSPSDQGGADLQPPRLICFGMAVPAGGSEWMLFLFHGAEGTASASGPHLADVIPEGFQRLLGLRGQNGELLAGVIGHGDPAVWQTAFESKLRGIGWFIQGDWSVVGRTRSARFRRTGADAGAALSIVMTADAGDGWTGLIHQLP